MPFLNRYNLFIKDTKAAISIEIAALVSFINKL
jgi:hypothetical protein